MADYQRVVEYLRDIRTSPVRGVTDELRQYAAEYAELCRLANERLRQCSTFLQQGLRSEAVGLADEPPNLLDLVSALDLPDPEAWAEVCQQWDLPLPPPLQLDRANQLNDAYAQDAGADELLRRHRLLALSRGPIRKRLEVMRQVAAIDSASAFWEKDLRVFERARLKEMRVECAAAVKDQDAPGIAALAAEIDNNTWLEPVPDDLRKAVGDTFNSMLRSEVEDNVQSVLKDLRAAYAAREVDRCAKFLQQCRQMFDAANQTAMSTHLALELQPIVAWVQRQTDARTRQQKAESRQRKFASALDADAPAGELAAAYAKLKEGGDGMPPELEQRYQAKLTERATTVRRRHILRLAIIGAAAAVVLVAVWMSLEVGTARSWVRRIDAAIEVRDLGRAQQLVSQPPRFANAASIAEARKRLADLLQAQQSDQRKLQLVLGEVAAIGSRTAVILAADSSGVDQITSAMAEIAAGLERLKTAAPLAWVDSNGDVSKTAFSLQETYNQLQTKATARASADARAELAQIAQAADALPATQPSEVDAALTALVELAGRARGLTARTLLDEPTKADATALAGRLEQRRQLIEQDRARLGEIAAIHSAAGSADQLKAALEAFVTRRPNDPLARDFTAAAQRAALAKPVEAWKALAASWDGKYAPTTEDAASQRAETIQGYLTVYAQSPMAEAATAYITYLQAAAGALAQKGTWQAAFEQVLATPLISELAYMESSDGRRYYVLGDINRKDSGANGRMTVTFDAIDPKNLTKRRQVRIAPPVTLVTQQPALAPHAKIANDISAKLKLIDETNWETFGMDLADTLVGNDQMELVVKAILLMQALKANEQVNGWAMGGLCDKSIRDLTRQAPETLVWYDPAAPLSDITRGALTKAIAAIPSGDAMKAALSARKTQLFKSLGFMYTQTGLLMRGSDGNLAFHGVGQMPAGGTLWIAGPSAHAGTQPAAMLMPIGSIKDGKAQLDATALQDVPEGTMAFVAK